MGQDGSIQTRPPAEQAPGPAPTDPVLRLELLSQPRLLAAVRGMVHQLARRIGFAETESSKIALALDEALCNVIRHGYDQREDGLIRLTVWITPKESDEPRLRLMIEDEARQVDPQSIRPRDLSEVRPGGLGVHLIREIMDDVIYEKRASQGMRLTLTKRHTPDSEEADGTQGTSHHGE